MTFSNYCFYPQFLTNIPHPQAHAILKEEIESIKGDEPHFIAASSGTLEKADWGDSLPKGWWKNHRQTLRPSLQSLQGSAVSHPLGPIQKALLVWATVTYHLLFLGVVPWLPNTWLQPTGYYAKSTWYIWVYLLL